jgi:hypothetical protein
MPTSICQRKTWIELETIVEHFEFHAFIAKHNSSKFSYPILLYAWDYALMLINRWIRSTQFGIT